MMSQSNHAPNEFRTSSPTDDSTSWHPPSSRFREHLSIDVPHPDLQVEQSHFSPDTPPPSPPPLLRASSSTHSHQPSGSVYSFGGSTMFSPRSKARDLEKGDSPEPPIMEEPLEDTSRASMVSGSPKRESRWGIRDRFTKFLWDAKSLKKQHSEAEFSMQTIEPTKLVDQWAPLNIEKRSTPAPPPMYVQQDGLPRCTCCQLHHEHQTKTKEGTLKKWRRRFLVWFIILFLLWVFGDLVALNVKVLSISSSTSSSVSSVSATVSSSAPSASSSPSSLSAAAQQCITEYTVNAPSSPTSYPCDTCLPLLADLPSSVTDSYSAAIEAVQFCALRSLWEDADSTGQSGLENGGWVEDVKFCSWSGVTCDSLSRVTSLYVYLVLCLVDTLCINRCFC